MKLYHGTTTKALASIRRKGLTPRGKRKSVWDENGVPSHPHRVYFSNAYAPYYAIAAANHCGGNPVVIEATIKPHKHFLVADEDAIEQALDGYDNLQLEKTARVLHYRERALEYNWQGSWEIMGTLAIEGGLPVEYLSRYVVLNEKNRHHQKFIMQNLDPTVSIANYRFCGHWYRNMTNWLFKIDDRIEASMPELEKELIIDRPDLLPPDEFKVKSFRRENAYG